jgi:hypothetical protein
LGPFSEAWNIKMADLAVPSNPYEKDAEAASKYVKAYLFPRKKGDFGASVEVIARLAQWAGHWGRKALTDDVRSG